MYRWVEYIDSPSTLCYPEWTHLRFDLSHQQSRDARISYDKLPALDRTPFKVVRTLNWSEGLDAALHRAGTLGPG